MAILMLQTKPFTMFTDSESKRTNGWAYHKMCYLMHLFFVENSMCATIIFRSTGAQMGMCWGWRKRSQANITYISFVIYISSGR